MAADDRDDRQAEVRARFERAYERWTDGEIAALRHGRERGLSVEDLSVLLRRPPSSVRSRVMEIASEAPPASDEAPVEAEPRKRSGRRRVYEILEVATSQDRLSWLADKLLMSLILLNVTAMIVESDPDISSTARKWLFSFEIASVFVFSVEYVLRIWSCTCSPSVRSPILGRIRFALGPFLLFDLLAILPFYLPFLGLDLRVLRMVRVFRVFRILKLARYSAALQAFGRVLGRTKEQLFVTIVFGLILLLISSTLLYYAEGHLQPEAFGSIPRAMWWAVITLTTVGYGDAFPATTLGKILASVIAVVGIGMFAMPAGILGAGFVAEFDRREPRG